MSLVTIERVASRATTVGVENPSRDLAFRVQHTYDDEEVEALAATELPATITLPSGLLLVLQNFRYEHLGGGVWDLDAHYGRREPRATGASSFTFDTSGATVHITQSKETVASYAVSGTAPDFKGAIGVNNDSVEGTDITVPLFAFQETHQIPVGMLTPSYVDKLYRLTGRTNAAAWTSTKGYEFDAGEVLFLGASGSERSLEDAEVAFRFVASPNVTDLSIGDILSAISKGGWEYLWVRYQDDEDENVLVKVPVAVYVERLYDPGNYGDLAW